MTPEQVLQWIQDTYGVRLNDEQIGMLASAIGFNGSNWSPQMANEAMRVVDEQAAANNIPRVATTTSGGGAGMAATTTTTPPLTGGPDPMTGATTSATEMPRTGGPDPYTASAFDMDAARTAVVNAIQAQYGVTLSPAQLQAVWEAISANGVTSTEQAVNSAMTWLSNPTNQQTILGIGGGGTSSGGSGGESGVGAGGGSGVGAGGGSAGGSSGGGGTPATTPPIDAEGQAVFAAWFRQTFGREARPEELQSYAQAVRYTGGRIEGLLLKRLQDVAILDQKSKGWLPVNPGQFQWTPFEYQAFNFAEQAPTYEAPGAFQFNEAPPEYEAPEAFRYREFTPPTLADITRDPAYQRRLEQGQRALETSAAARGTLRTGATLRGLAEYGQNLASEEYQNAYQRQRGEYEMGQQQARAAYDADVQRRQDAFNARQQNFQNRMGIARTRYEADTDRARSGFSAATQSWQNRFNQAQSNYATNRQSAETAFNARRQQELLQWQRDYDVWRYLNDDAYRRAQIASTASQV
jgi:hypothetical protein